ncbi:THxN family PEP-CTERM protein [Sedimentitalea nanhaiensis]|uniref:VPLPA-CTERM protein sorting domain-containing protein n=1 Tax=Sedimentitalea nanhaiensis TaxID=999627 RepID=A0A1I7DTW9_9RHOB|nr:THxN family PEP-CTERM protein [Sedimentitalea nanhaiensis]SFU15094.1 VPLPA-CTERM protein sorting domain-containing protein [Sedimentitalea nanhaiensis]
MTFTTRIGAASAIALLVGAAGASAATLDISGISAGWSAVDPVSVTINNGDPLSTLRWGGDTGEGQSGYDFTRAATPINNIAEDTAFLVGNFVHLNNPVFPPSLNSANLDVDITIVNGPGVISSTFSMSHNETTNSGNCGGDGSVIPCDDYITVSNAPGGTAFSIGNVDYVFQVLGFSTDGGTTILDQFRTQEEQNNPAGLYAKFTATTNVNVVPLPAAGWLLLAGVGGLAAVRRKKKAA